MLKLTPRALPSLLWQILSPLLAIILTTTIGIVLFSLLGTDPAAGLQMFFIEPWRNAYAIGELCLKATPLILIGLGLAVCFRANIWNIGAEGQFILGAIFASGVALQADARSGDGFIALVWLTGIIGGMCWAAITALLRDRFNTNEILVSLMLVYVAIQLLSFLVSGPWKDPHGYNFPQTQVFLAAAQTPRVFTGSRLNIGFPVALLLAVTVALFLFRTYTGYALQVGGLAPAAARYAGFSPTRTIWTALLLSGGLAGLAGALEVSGPVGQLTQHVPVGYGFAAIIVTFVGRLHPLGVILSALLLSMFYIGGELAQSRLGLPKSITFVFQGLLLFNLLACDTLINNTLTWKRR